LFNQRILSDQRGRTWDCQYFSNDAEAKDSDHPPDGVPREYWDSVGPVGRHTSVLGWEINLSAWTVDVADKNRIRAIHAFGSFDPRQNHSRKTYETLCSYAERYSKVSRGLAPLMHHLYEMLSGWPAKTRHQGIPSADFRIASKLWLAYMLLSAAQAATNATHGRSLDSFRPRTDKVIIEFDGSLKGIGANVNPRGDDAQETVIAAWAPHFPIFDLGGDSSYPE
jgi:hypothetical protein